MIFEVARIQTLGALLKIETKEEIENVTEARREHRKNLDKYK